MAKSNKVQNSDPLVKELDAIKRLLILDLLKSGITQAEIAKALGVDAAIVSRMMPARQFTGARGK